MIKNSKDFWAGLMFVGLGLFASIVAHEHYHMGTAVRMGPGYFPTVLGGVLAVLGAVILLRSLTLSGGAVARFHFRQLLFVLVGCVAYGYLMVPLGVIVATAVLVLVSARGGHEFRWKEVAVLCVVMALFSVLVFVEGLNMPFPLWPSALQ